MMVRYLVTSLIVVVVVATLFDGVCARKKVQKHGASRHRGRRCGSNRCGTGQECSTRKDGQKECICRQLCNPRRRLVCGSDGRTYYNHCELHRIACIEGRRIKIGHKGHCKKDSSTQPKTDVDLILQKEGVEHQLPLVCYQIQRDELRQLLVDWLERKAAEKGWTDKGKVNKAAANLYRSCDKNNDRRLEADELLKCIEKRDSSNANTADDHILRGLCVDALVNMGDKDDDWALSLEEFQESLDPDLVPEEKECSLEEEKYRDGAETEVDCNKCVCACGDWVCTGAPCPDKTSSGKPGRVQSGSLPSIDQRETFLNGFKASKEIRIDAVQNEVEQKQHAQEIIKELHGLKSRTHRTGHRESNRSN